MIINLDYICNLNFVYKKDKKLWLANDDINTYELYCYDRAVLKEKETYNKFMFFKIKTSEVYYDYTYSFYLTISDKQNRDESKILILSKEIYEKIMNTIEKKEKERQNNRFKKRYNVYCRRIFV